MDHTEAFPTITSRELFDVICGKKLGEGIARTVYECAVNPLLVVKFEKPGWFQNVQEMNFWDANCSYQPVAKWLAPCKFISPCGRVLLQVKVEPINDREMPASIPSWATDEKAANWGMLNGKPVMCDYGMILYSPSKRMKKRRTYDE